MSGTRSQHGSQHRYARLGCRCPMCVEAHRARTAASRAARLAEGRISHGTRSGYDAGCRCETCRDARRSAYRRLRSEKPKAQSAT